MNDIYMKVRRNCSFVNTAKFCPEVSFRKPTRHLVLTWLKNLKDFTLKVMKRKIINIQKTVLPVLI